MKNNFAALSERQVECHELSDLHLAVADRDGQIANLKQAVADRDVTIVALQNSTSWRITWPLRIAAR